MAWSTHSKHNGHLHSSLTRRQALPLFGATAAMAVLARPGIAVESPDRFGGRPAAKARFVYIGTYTFPQRTVARASGATTAFGGTGSFAICSSLFRANQSAAFSRQPVWE